MSEQNKAFVRDTLEAIWNQGDEAAVEQRLVTDYLGHSGLTIRGPEGARRFVAAMRQAFPDYHYAVEDEIAEGDRVVHRWTARGTHQGPFQGVSPTGRVVTISGISIYRVVNGQLVESWTTSDLLGLMRQLAVAPEPGK